MAKNSNDWGWIDFSRRDQKVARDIIAAMNMGAVDELGIGSIRDKFADLLFPGTSQIQTIAKYFLVVAGEIKYLTDLPPMKSIDDYFRELAQLEKEDSLTMWNNLSKEDQEQDNTGVFGSSFFAKDAKEDSQWVVRTPAAVYWNGIRKLGIFSPDWILSTLFAQATKQSKVEEISDDKTVVQEKKYGREWNWHLPQGYKYTPHNPNLTTTLTPTEAEFLIKIIEEKQCATLLCHLIQHRQNYRNAAQWPRSFSELYAAINHELPFEVQEIAHGADVFSKFLYPAQIRYNCLLNNESAQKDWHTLEADGENKRQDLLSQYNEYCRPIIENSKYFPASPSLNSAKKFLQDLAKIYEHFSQDNFDELLRNRENLLKGGNAKGASSSRCKLPSTGQEPNAYYQAHFVGSRYLDYRYANVKTLINNIVEAEQC